MGTVQLVDRQVLMGSVQLVDRQVLVKMNLALFSQTGLVVD